MFIQQHKKAIASQLISFQQMYAIQEAIKKQQHLLFQLIQ